MSSPAIIQVSNETTNSSSRITKEGRKITYRMTVIQQPERARACGSGAKSSADRRPVDPPPIVDLKVFEGPQAEHDITFSYKANFFLFATLENARHLAQGRVPAQSQPSFPVLTGTPVAGMAYLDRPNPAGYFIFPDLSVRHEGKYRLSFSLYEELKDTKDMDSETPDNLERLKSAHVSHRLEVKSMPFTVFSAKKFPGLAESTALSRIVAEQGCRVRIRRDVRMRRRDVDRKSGRDYDDFEDERSYDRSRATATPDAYGAPQPMHTPQAQMDPMDRPRSTSNASNASFAAAHRASSEHVAQPYQQPYVTSPVTPQTPQGMYAQNQTSQWHSQPPQSVSQMQPPSYPSRPSYPPPPPPQQTPPMSSPYGYMPPQYQSHEQNHTRHNSIEYPAPPTEPPRSSTTPQPQMQQPPHHLQHQQEQYQTQQYQTQQPQQQHYNNGIHSGHPYQTQNGGYGQHQSPQTVNMAPLPTPPPSYSGSVASQQHLAQSNGTNSHYNAPVVQSPVTTESYQDREYSDSQPVAPPKFAHQPQPSGATKRSYGSTFSTDALEQRLQQGARPLVTAEEPRSLHMNGTIEDEPSPLEGAMSYRRADGTERCRRVPMIGDF